MLSYINQNWSLDVADDRRHCGSRACRRVTCDDGSGAVEHDKRANNELNGPQATRAVYETLRNPSASPQASFSSLSNEFRSLGADDSLRKYIEASNATDRASAARDLLHDIAGLSELSLDPEATSYYVMDIVSLRLPNVYRAVSVCRTHLMVTLYHPRSSLLALQSFITNQ